MLIKITFIDDKIKCTYTISIEMFLFFNFDVACVNSWRTPCAAMTHQTQDDIMKIAMKKATKFH